MPTSMPTSKLLILLYSFVAIPKGIGASQPSRARPLVSLRDFVSYFLRFNDEQPLLFEHGDDANNKSQDLLVIGAGYARTGTSSFVEALRLLDLKSYHTKHGVLDERGHLDLWYRLAMEHLKHNDENDDRDLSAWNRDSYLGRTSFDAIVKQIRRDGFNATADVPNALYFEEFMEKYPNAKVVLTVRSSNGGGNEDQDYGAEAWAQSMLQTVGRITQLCARVPYKWIPFTKKYCSVVRMIRKLQNVPIDETTHLPHPRDLAHSYQKWNAYVQSKVPKERLLVFSPKDGWAPLCEFLSPVHATVEQRCNKILATNQAYPRYNDSESVASIVNFLGLVASLCEWSPFLLVGLLVALCWFRGGFFVAKTVKID